MTSGLYHGGGVGGGPGPGVCGSPPSSRARRFHFPGCPGVNIRVSAPLPPRRAAATFLPRPGQARARPPRSRLSANERAGPRRSPSMERGAGGRSGDRGSEGRGLRAGPGRAAGRVGGPGRCSEPGVACQSVSGLIPGVGFCPHPDPATCFGAAEAAGGRGTVPAGLPGGDAEGTGAGRGQSLPAPPGARAHSRGGPGTSAAHGPSPAWGELSERT